MIKRVVFAIVVGGFSFLLFILLGAKISSDLFVGCGAIGMVALVIQKV